MRTLFSLSLTAGYVSWLGFQWVWLDGTMVRTAAEARWRTASTIVLAVFYVAWLCLAFWSRPRPLASSSSRWLLSGLVALGAYDCIVVLFLVLG